MNVKNITLLLTTVLMLSACIPVSNAPSVTQSPVVSEKPEVFTDAAGISVELSGFPQRIVIEGIQTQMIVDFFYLFPGQSAKIVGLQKKMQTADNFLLVVDPAAAGKLNLEENASAEQVAPLHPDLVILKTVMMEKLGGGLAAINIPTVYMDFENPDQFTREINNMGIILDQQQRAEEINALFSNWQERVTTKLAELTDENKPTALVLQLSEKDNVVAFSVPSPSFLQTATIEMAGGIPVWKDDFQGGGWNTVSLEQIAAWDADMIFVINYNSDSKEIVADMYADPIWQQIRAVKNNQLFGFPRDFISWDQPDPRWVLGFNWLGNKLHPDLVTFNTAEIVNEFYSDFYNIDSTTIEEKIIPLLKGDLP